MTNVVTEVFDYLYYPGFHDQCCYWDVWSPILSWFPWPMLLLRCLITYIILVSMTNVVTEVFDYLYYPGFHDQCCYWDVWLHIISWFPWPMLLLRCLITYIILVSMTNVVIEMFDYLYYPGFHDQCCYWDVWLPILSWFPWPMLLLRCLNTYITLVSMTNVATEMFDYLYYPGFHDQCCYWDVWLPILPWFPWPMLLLRCLITCITLISMTNVVTEMFDYLYYPGFHDQCCYWDVWLPILPWFPWPMLLLRCLITYITLVSMTNVVTEMFDYLYYPGFHDQCCYWDVWLHILSWFPWPMLLLRCLNTYIILVSMTNVVTEMFDYLYYPGFHDQCCY